MSTCIAVILVSYWMFYYDPTVYMKPIPTRIWTFYEPPLNITDADRQQMAEIEWWSLLHPGWDVIRLTRKNATGYLRIPPALLEHPMIKDPLHPERFITLCRFYALIEHGGVWLDATVKLQRPLPTWMFPRYGDLALIHDHSNPQLLTHVLACKKENPWIRAWKEEWIQLTEFQSPEEYLHSRTRLGPVDVRSIEDPMHHLEQVAFQTVIQIKKGPIEKDTSVILHRSAQGLH